jgi:hypothetical protein
MVSNGTPIDLVARFSTERETTLWLARSESALFVYVAEQSPASAALTVLNPRSCRPVSSIDLVTSQHVQVGIGQDLELTLVGDDPHDGADPFDPLEHATETSLCANADPSATPVPLPSLVAGEWLEEDGTALWCDSTGTFGLRVELFLGALVGCEAFTDSVDQGEEFEGVTVSNPEGDPSALSITWQDNLCVDGGTVALWLARDGYMVSVISTSRSCGEGRMRYGAVLYLADAIDPRSVVTEIQRNRDLR